MKRKKMIKLLMANGIPRNKAVFCANACGGQMSHRYMMVFALCRPDVVDYEWNLWVRVLRKLGYHPKLMLVRDGQA